MRGGHDLGGQQEMGPINPEPESQEPVFHSEWERRVFGLTLASGMLGRWNIDESRHARERQDPLRYIENSYYENWLEGLEKLLVEKGLLDSEELSQRQSLYARAGEPPAAPNSAAAQQILASGSPSTMESQNKPKYQLGDRVLVRVSEVDGHTRAPRYAQGATGKIVASLGCHSFPDSNARGIAEGQHLYRVAFAGAELWGEESNNSEVLIDLWEAYLDRATR